MERSGTRRAFRSALKKKKARRHQSKNKNMKNKIEDRPIRASLRRFILRRVEHWEARIDCGEDLHTAYLMRSVLLGILLRAGYVVRHDKRGRLVVC